MKKLLSLALVALIALSANAASIAWKSTALSFDGATLKSNTSVVGYLIYLGNSASLDASYAITDSFDASSIGTVAQTDSNGTAKAGQVGETLQFAFGSYQNNDAFALLVSYTTEGKTYWNLSSTINSLSGLSDELSTPADFTTFAFNNATAENGTLKAGGGWTAVPEPASAMLALAGVAMLIRRRK